jgi:hypothetical protein
MRQRKPKLLRWVDGNFQIKVLADGDPSADVGNVLLLFSVVMPADCGAVS